MDRNTILSLNNIIFQIYNTAGFQDLKRELLKSLQTLIPHRCGSILMAGEGTNLLADPYCLPEQYLPMEQRYLMIESQDFSRWILQKQQTTIVRATDLMPDGERERTALYISCFAPYGLHYSVDMTIAYKGVFLGTLTLYRSRADGDFSGEEVFLLQNISDHLNVRFYRETFGGSGEDSLTGGRVARCIRAYALTPREGEILSLVFAGKDNSEITQALCISENTLKKHLQNLYRKTGASRRMQLQMLDSPQSSAVQR